MVEERPAGRGWIDLIQSTLIEVARVKMGSPNPQLIENKRENDKIKKRRRNSQNRNNSLLQGYILKGSRIKCPKM